MSRQASGLPQFSLAALASGPARTAPEPVGRLRLPPPATIGELPNALELSQWGENIDIRPQLGSTSFIAIGSGTRLCGYVLKSCESPGLEHQPRSIHRSARLRGRDRQVLFPI
ncbi:MAG: hypothetical protein AAFY98_01815 [Verrucomicrobiota bacterium]